MQLLGAAHIRDLAELLDVTPTKKLGQNFVIDANTVRRIVRVGGVGAGDVVLEVGPGLGSLTLGLLEADATVVAVEIDGRLAAQLPITVAELAPEAAGRLTVVHQDALKIVDLPVAPSHLVANLPYNVSVPVLLHLLQTLPGLRGGVVMVQAEVGQRLAAEPGSKVYGAPSVKAAWYGEWRTAGQVSRQVFWPVPNVDSILVAFQRHEISADPSTDDPCTDDPRADEGLRRRVSAVVDAAFGQRRKMLRQALAGVFGNAAQASAALETAGLPTTARGEELTVEQFTALGRLLPTS